MGPFSHLSYPLLFFVLIAKIFHIQYSFLDLWILMFCSVLPDFDLLFFSISGKSRQFSFSKFLALIFLFLLPGSKFFSDKFETPPKHRAWFSHWPIVYSLLIILFLLNSNLKLFLICLGIYSHFLLDTLIGTGVMWFYPFSRKSFNLLPGKLKDCDGLECFQIYKKTIFYKIDIIAFGCLLLILIKSLQNAGFI